MLQLSGSQAYSDFRVKKLLAQLQSVCPTLSKIETEFQHFIKLVDDKQPLTGIELDTVARLLQYGPQNKSKSERNNEANTMVLALPRFGTISPWSTKATDIARHCGLDKVKRIERGIAFYLQFNGGVSQQQLTELTSKLHDPMTESVVTDFDSAARLFEQSLPQSLVEVAVMEEGKVALEKANQEFGLALSADEIDYLVEQYLALGKNPTDVELMMFAQVNSEHCRHKIFNADWVIDGVDKPHSLFRMIRETHEQNSEGTIVAYSDNSAVIAGSEGQRFFSDAKTHEYKSVNEPVHILCKVETHNHPTAISPFPGAATGSGGEIRDEGATGRGSKPKAGLTGFSVSNLRLPDLAQPWETPESKPQRIASPLQIMLEGPIGGAAFNNEFGRPNIAGYFRTYEQAIANDADVRGYHKPIMLAGGLGNIREKHVNKQIIPDGSYIVVLGGPAMLIGLGGGAASSVSSGTSSEALDFASVQRGNPEMQRRCQEVIDACWGQGENNPIISIHDIGAGGLCNALPELVGDAGRGGTFNLRDVLNDEAGMSPMQIWCNEAQERYCLAVSEQRLAEFEALCQRERCLYCVVGQATDDEVLVLHDSYFADGTTRQQTPIDLPMEVLFGKAPKMLRTVAHADRNPPTIDLGKVELREALHRVLSLPAVADKSFLITIGDRSVTGMIARDQMVGPWQVPVADVAVTTSDYSSICGEAMAMGERTPLASVNAPASGRMAVAEALTNLCAANVRNLHEVKLSANWMAAAGHEGDDAALYDTVEAIGMELCPQLGIAIPVGKDSMSMKTVWQDDNGNHSVTAPVSCVISAFAPVDDASLTVTPYMAGDLESSSLFFLDLANGQQRLACSALTQVYNQVGGDTPDVEDPEFLKTAFNTMQALIAKGLISAYHDRSDGGLIVSLLEMAFASRCGLNIDLSGSDTAINALFNEELGMVFQVAAKNKAAVLSALNTAGASEALHEIGNPVQGDRVIVKYNNDIVVDQSRTECHRVWSATSYQMQKLRDNPECAEQEYDRLLDHTDSGLFAELSFDVNEDIAAPFIGGNKPKIAILREQGVNSHLEMAAAFSQSGFAAIDVTMSDIVDGRITLDQFHGLVACGGFSFGDVLGAGEGWAKSILFNEQIKEQFSDYFARDNAFALGICNGCQMMSNLKDIIPGAEHWPHFVRNHSEQFEARFVQTEITQNNSVLLSDMQGSKLPVVVSHGEGRAEFANQQQLTQVKEQVVLRYTDNLGHISEQYPYNPNGSPQGIAGLCNKDGRVTIMMPHPERIFRSVTNSWADPSWGQYGPWMRMFRTARRWLG